MAICYQLLDQHQQVETLLRDVVKYDPNNQEAGALLAEYEVKSNSVPEISHSIRPSHS